ncbi:VOC family protein [Nonomuraea recticatena]|uniref:VOC family protein n=1 Tax=Nonomuraea recticatena TaxID=46178 RepID=A0ABP6DHS8_9ACTN
MSEIGFGLVLDVADPDTLAPFWAEALHYSVVGGVGNYVMLRPEGRSGPRLLLQKVKEGRTGKNRMHLDLDAADIEAEVNRLEALGARRLENGEVEEHGHRWVVMADPEGNEFCVGES